MVGFWLENVSSQNISVYGIVVCGNLQCLSQSQDKLEIALQIAVIEFEIKGLFTEEKKNQLCLVKVTMNISSEALIPNLASLKRLCCTQ